MPIDSHTIREGAPQADGRRYVRVTYVFDTGEKMQVGPRLVGPDFDVEARALEMIPQLETAMVDAEDNRLLEKVLENGTGILTVIPNHPSTDTVQNRQRRFRRLALRRAYSSSDPKVVRRTLYSLWSYLKNDTGYTAQQIASYFDVTLPQLVKFDDRMQAIHDNLDFLDNDSGEEIE
jgi:hypothetical protein